MIKIIIMLFCNLGNLYKEINLNLMSQLKISKSFKINKNFYIHNRAVKRGFQIFKFDDAIKDFDEVNPILLSLF